MRAAGFVEELAEVAWLKRLLHVSNRVTFRNIQSSAFYDSAQVSDFARGYG
jgi:hypothetical protein